MIRPTFISDLRQMTAPIVLTAFVVGAALAFAFA
jgi:hypothetical protein